MLNGREVLTPTRSLLPPLWVRGGLVEVIYCKADLTYLDPHRTVMTLGWKVIHTVTPVACGGYFNKEGSL